MLLFSFVGRITLGILREAGAIGIFFSHFVAQAFRRPRLRLLVRQMATIGFDSLPIVVLTAFFTGGVLALQSYAGFENAALANSQIGPLVALSMLRELGPVLASLMVAGRVGAAIAAELGTMRVTEQIDALKTLATDPIQYLVVPRILACLITVPMLVVIANVIGILGGYTVAVNILDINPYTFLNGAFNVIDAGDITLGLVKAAVFGTIVGLMGCYHGYTTRGGAQGVGKATTIAVVYASVSILVSDYFITALWM